MIRRLFVLLAVLATLAAPPAFAAQWQVGGDASLAFAGRYQGEGFAGRFQRFDAAIRFDGNDLATASFTVEVDLASASTGNEDYDSTVVGPEFFDVERFPKARFVTTAFRKTGDRSYEADATLTLRDRSQPLVFPFTFVRDGDSARLTATVVIKRLDYEVGTGDWTDTELIANEVEVRVDLPLTLKADPAP
jgi:polyisoprenoid-binding protein YceI